MCTASPETVCAIVQLVQEPSNPRVVAEMEFASASMHGHEKPYVGHERLHIGVGTHELGGHCTPTRLCAGEFLRGSAWQTQGGNPPDGENGQEGGAHNGQAYGQAHRRQVHGEAHGRQANG